MSNDWTYTQDPANSTRDAVRFLTGDTDPTDRQLTDAEVAYVLSQEPNVYLAAASAARTLNARYARQATDKQVGDLRVVYTQRAEHYSGLAKDLERRGNMRSARPYASGITKTDADAALADTNRKRPAFRVGLMDDPGRVEPEEGTPWADQ